MVRGDALSKERHLYGNFLIVKCMYSRELTEDYVVWGSNSGGENKQSLAVPMVRRLE